jgi:mannose-6-phosphate isomerase-like protein (cupin superfamily)
MKINSDVISGNIIRDTEVYVVEDNRFLNNLCVSKTILHPDKETSGHSHLGLEEVYFFKSGTGIMQLDDQRIDVKSDDIILIPDGTFHKVFNTGNSDLIFVCVFQSYERTN